MVQTLSAFLDRIRKADLPFDILEPGPVTEGGDRVPEYQPGER